MAILSRIENKVLSIVCESYEEAFAQAAELKGVASLEIESEAEYSEDGAQVTTWTVTAVIPVAD